VPQRLGEILVGEGACTAAALRDALKNQIIFGGRLGTNLLELRAVSEEALARALGRQHGIPSLSGALRLDPAATALLTPEIAERWDAVPYVLADRRMALLVVDPKNLAMLDEVAFATGKQVHPIVVPEARVWALLGQTYGLERHLRGIDVEFGSLRATPARRVEAARSAERAPDLMDEEAFQGLYGKGASSPPPATSGSTPAPPAPPAPIPPPAAVAALPPPGPGGADDVVELSDLLVPEAPPPALAPEVLAALRTERGHAPPSRLVRPFARPDAPQPSPLAFDEAVRFLEGVTERGAIATTVLRYARSKFERAVLFTVHRGGAHGWAGLGASLGPEAVQRIHVALGAPGIVDTVVSTRAHFLGPIPKTEANVRLLRALRGGVPANAFLVPILAVGRVVNVFYADNGRGGLVDAGGVGELLILATRIAKSYDALLARVR
jgi:hypothetical protein